MNSAPHSIFIESSRSSGAIFGAFYLSVEKLDWQIVQAESGKFCEVKTGIEGAANDELVALTIESRGFRLSSRSTGEYALHQQENEENIERLWQLMNEYLHSNSENSLLKAATRMERQFYGYGTGLVSGLQWLLKGQFLYESGGRIALLLAGIHIAIFLVMVLQGAGFMEMKSESLIDWGGNITYNVLNGEYWRLLTNTFLHGGFGHLASNLYGLFVGGIAAESLLGQRRFFIAYLVCGIFASAVSFAMHDEVLSVGASGAIFGTFGLVLGIASTKTLRKSERIGLLMGFGVFVGLNFLLGFSGTTDNWAHIGGLVCGWVGGFLWAITLKRKERIFQRRLMDIAVPVCAIFLSAGLVALKPAALLQYMNLVENYEKFTQRAFEFYPENGHPDSEAIKLLTDSGILYLDSALLSLKKASELKKLPKHRLDHLYKVQVLGEIRRDIFYFTRIRYISGEARYEDSVQNSIRKYKELEDAYF